MEKANINHSWRGLETEKAQERKRNVSLNESDLMTLTPSFACLFGYVVPTLLCLYIMLTSGNFEGLPYHYTAGLTLKKCEKKFLVKIGKQG